MWINKPVKDCPICRTVIYKKELGKEFDVYWKIFLQGIQAYPNDVFSVLNQSDHQNDTCGALCSDDLPIVPIKYNARSRQLYHDKCAPTNAHSLTMVELAAAVKAVAAKDTAIAQELARTVFSVDSNPWVNRVIIVLMVTSATLICLMFKKIIQQHLVAILNYLVIL